MNCNTTHYRANSSSVPGDPTETKLRKKLELDISPAKPAVPPPPPAPAASAPAKPASKGAAK